MAGLIRKRKIPFSAPSGFDEERGIPLGSVFAFQAETRWDGFQIPRKIREVFLQIQIRNG